MGEYNHSVLFHYERKNLTSLLNIANDITVDEDDRKLAKELAEELKKELSIPNLEKNSDGEER